jgi:hypothetical protein
VRASVTRTRITATRDHATPCSIRGALELLVRVGAHDLNGRTDVEVAVDTEDAGVLVVGRLPAPSVGQVTRALTGHREPRAEW